MYLRATPSTITAAGQAVTLSWKTENATSITIDNGVGSVTPVAEGSVVVHPTGNTTYKAHVVGANGSANCQASVQIQPPQTAAQCVFLTATPNEINSGEAVTLRWKTTNATSISINNGVGNVTPVAEGSIVVRPTVSTTYVATVTGATGSVNCSAPVTIKNSPPGPACISLTASDTTIEKGDEITLTWRTKDAASISINQGIGNVTPVAEGSIKVRPDGDTTYVASVPNAPSNSACSVEVKIEDTSCKSNCGGGGGGGSSRSKPKVLLDSLETPGEQPLAFVYLSEVPYTGLELGPIGTAVYWIMLIGWSAAAAYLVLFTGVPFMLRRAKSFGSGVRDALNSEPEVHGHGSHAVHSTHDAHAPVAHDPYHTPAPAGYSPAVGFRSFAPAEGALSIDDIVKGLSRMSEAEPEPHAVVPAGPAHDVAPMHEYVAPQAAPVNVEGPASIPTHLPTDVPGFLHALLNGDRDGAFGAIREVTRTGGSSEEFLTHAVCALDDAYRSRIDGTAVHPEVARLTQSCATPFLERLVTSLTTAVDGSYSAGVTGVKLAVTRALAVVNG